MAQGATLPKLLGLDLGQRYVGVSKANKYLTGAEPLEWIDCKPNPPSQNQIQA
jgi:RNase H-fold protein (predicted Holliday junction resolvase)